MFKKKSMVNISLAFLITLSFGANTNAKDAMDWNGDGRTGLEETIYSLQVVAGIQDEGWYCQDDDTVNNIYRTCNYFPLELGNRWEFTTGSRLSLNSEQSCSTGLTGIRYGTNGYEYEPIMQNKELGLATGCQYEMPENDFADFGINMVFIDPEMAIGQTTTHSYFDGNWTFITTLVGLEQVVVPSGTYNALKYEIVTNDVADPLDTCSFKTTIWLAKGIGPVKIHRTDAIPTDCSGCMFVCRPDNNYTIVNTPAELIRADVSGVQY